MNRESKEDNPGGGFLPGGSARLEAVAGFDSSGELCSEVLEFFGDDDFRRVRRATEEDFGFLKSV